MLTILRALSKQKYTKLIDLKAYVGRQISVLPEPTLGHLQCSLTNGTLCDTSVMGSVKSPQNHKYFQVPSSA